MKRNCAMCVLGLLMGTLAVASLAFAVDFDNLQTLQGGIGFTTVLEFGVEDPNPATTGDGCLYAVNGSSGAVHRICFDDNKSVTSNTVVIDINGGGGTNNVLGITIDPNSDPAGAIHLYLGYSDSNNAPNNGKIARAVSTDGGVTYAVDEDFITGLGRSAFDHQTNGLDFGPDGCLYVSQGNMSNAGYDVAYAETRLSSAILRACFNSAPLTVDPGFDRDCGGGGLQQACDVEVYASGLRNPYDIVWHSNGNLYNSDNDANPGFRDSCPNVANTFGCPCQEPQVNPVGDEINLIEQGAYYGSPNPYLANPAGLQCQGGTDSGDACVTDGDCGGVGTCEDLSALCTDGLCGDPAHCFYFGFGENPLAGEDPNGIYRAPIAQIGSTLDGLTEYRAGVDHLFPGSFCSDWDGDLLVTAGPGAVRRFDLSADGLSATHEGTANLNGATGLDVVVGPDGTIYVADLNGGQVTFLEPLTQSNPALPDFFLFCNVGVEMGTWDIGGAPASLPVGRSDLAAATLEIGGNDYIFVFGQAGTNVVLRYDVANDLWASSTDPGTPGAPPNPPFPFNGSPTSNHKAAVDLNGLIYSIGGLNPFSNETRTYDGLNDPAPNQLSDIGCNGAATSCPGDLNVGAVATAAINGQVYIAGGLCTPSDPGCTCNGIQNGTTGDCSGNGGPGSNTDRAFRYEPATDDWFEIATMPVALDHTAGAAMDGKFHVFGGRQCGQNTACEGRTETQIYDPATDSWSLGAPMPEGCSGMGSAVVLNNRAYVIGGEGGSCSGSAVQEYNPVTDSWRMVASLPNVHHGIWPVRVGNPVDGIPDELFVAGGSPNNTDLHVLTFSCEECGGGGPSGGAGPQCTMDADCDDGQVCTADACQAGECVNSPLDLQVECDGIFCTFGDTCVAGECQPGIPDSQNCDDQIACTTDVCDVFQGCLHNDTCPLGEICNPANGVCEMGGDPDNDGLEGPNDPCPADALNGCFGPVAVDDTAGQDIRINTGPSCTTAVIDCRGASWTTDFGAVVNQSSSTCSLPNGCPVDATALFGCSDASTEAIFKCEHWDPGAAPELQYSFDVPNGNYLVNLVFMNTFTGTAAVGTRVFDILVEGALAYDDFDQVAAAGGPCDPAVSPCVPVNRATVVTVEDGNGLQIELIHGVENPAIKGIEVLQAPLCTMDGDCDDGNPCTDDICASGTCTNPNNTAPCDDGVACTTGDICAGGICAGTPDDALCDDSNDCTIDTCTAGGCDNAAVPDGTPCDDGFPGTPLDQCIAGVCVGEARVTVALVAVPTPTGADEVPALPVSTTTYTVGDAFHIEVWAQTIETNGLSSVTVDVGYDASLINASGLTNSAVFNQFTSGTIDNGAGAVDDVGGSHPVVVPPCNDQVGLEPSWARVATIDMLAVFGGSQTVSVGDAASPLFGTAICNLLGNVNPAEMLFEGVVVTTLCQGSDETCDGIDDDCNGTADDGYVPTPTACGVGACVAGGTLACIGGSEVDSCVPGVPAAEVCDGLDNDCNGIDDDEPDASASCAGGDFCSGTFVCSGGACVPDMEACPDECEACNPDTQACEFCVYDHNMSGVIDGLDFAFFSGCFGSCYASADPCFDANYDGDAGGCVGGGDFGLFSGCFSLTCGECTLCFPWEGGPAPEGPDEGIVSVVAVPVARPSADDFGIELPGALKRLGVGQTFYVELWARADGFGDGLASAYVDIVFDPARIDVRDHRATAQFPNFAHDAELLKGRIATFGGCAQLGDGALGFGGEWVRIGIVEFVGRQAGEVQVLVEPARAPFGVSIFARPGDLAPSALHLDGTSVWVEGGRAKKHADR